MGSSMVIASKTKQAVICLEEQAFSGVVKIAGKVAEDLELVSGQKVEVLSFKDDADLAQKTVGRNRVIAATIGHSAYLEQLQAEGIFDASLIAGKWEVYAFLMLPAKQEGEGDTLLIAGSDKRGTIYGLFHLSELAGVSPWVWFADAKPAKKDEILVSEADCLISKEPSVRYRGFFINDEWPAYGNWTFSHFGGFTAQMYDHVFELLLRMKGNYLWPAMWTSNFSLDGPGMANAILADEYGVVMSNSHHEPCLRHSEEWDLVKGENTPYGTAWNFDRNKQGLTNYWRDGLKRNGALENIITMGMRGERDSEVLGTTATLADNINYLKEVITTQNELIVETINPDLTKTQRMLAIYKEVENYFHGDATTEGLKTWDGLDGITCMLCEDNFGNLRTLPEEGQRERKGGWGMYYHFDYHGDPVSYEWINSTHISRTCEQMTQAYEFGIRQIWIVNVGDLKPQELPLSYFLDLAYDIDKWGASREGAVEEYLKLWTAQQFPALAENQEAIESLLEGYTRINYIHKPEALRADTYHPTHYGEADAMIAKAEKLEALAEEIWAKAQNTADADVFYQLVYYPVMAAMNLLKLQVKAGQNHYLASIGAIQANTLADEMKVLLARDRELMEAYHSLNGGKWSSLMLSEHIGFKNWNDEECQAPVRMYVEPANKPRVIVTAGDDTVATMGGDWTRKKLSIQAFLDPTVNESYVDLRTGTLEPIACTIETQDSWILPAQTQVQAGECTRIQIRIDRVALMKQLQSQAQAEGKAFDATAPVWASGMLTIRTKQTHVDIQVSVLCMDAKQVVPMTEAMQDAAKGFFMPGLTLDMTDADAFGGTDEKYFRVIPGFGKYEAGIKAIPETTYFVKDTADGACFEDAPTAAFTFTMPRSAEVEITLLTAPSNPVDKGNPMALGLALNGEKLQKVATVPEGFEGGDRVCPQWGEGVLNQIHVTKLTMQAKAGENQLVVAAGDPGTVLERILVRQSGTKWAEGYIGKLPGWLQ